MTAWQKLIAGSTLPSGTAWQHLNAQGGGSGAGDIFIYDEIGVELMAQDYDVELSGELNVELEDEFSVELEDETA